MRIDEIYKLLEAPEDGTFAGVRFDNASADKLRNFTHDNNIPNPVPIEDFHSTLLFSHNPIPNYQPHGKLRTPLTAEPNDVKIWGEDDEKCLVVTLNCPKLVARHEQLMKQHPEATWDHPEYIPHVTLSYNVGDFDPHSIDVSQIGTLTIDEEYGDDIDPDWKKDD